MPLGWGTPHWGAGKFLGPLPGHIVHMRIVVHPSPECKPLEDIFWGRNWGLAFGGGLAFGSKTKTMHSAGIGMLLGA